MENRHDGKLSAKEARQDTIQLLDLLGSAHPDPFARAGGQIAFFRQADAVLRSIPEDGTDTDAFLRLLRPLVALVGDGHTTIFDPATPDELVDSRAMGTSSPSQPRLWIDWEAIEEQLVVAAVYEEEHRALIGARLHSVADVPFPLLCERMQKLRGDDNVHNNLVHLSEALGHPTLLFELLECAISEILTLTFADATGDARTERVQLVPDVPGERRTAQSSVTLEPTGPSRIASQLLGDGSETMLLRIGPMMWYREAFEVWRHYGYHRNLTHHLDQLVRDLGHDPPSDDLDDRIACVPSASAIFVAMLAEMERVGARSLIVDLRESTGGNSVIASILQFVLFGLDGMIDHDSGYQVRRLSPLFFENNRNLAPESADDLAGYYDFSEERNWRARRGMMSSEERAAEQDAIVDAASASPTFTALLEDFESAAGGDFEIIVVTSARTYSAGFDMAAMLYKHGATVVGVPSSQAGNCFIDTLRYRLDNSGLQGRISYKWSLLFPGDPETGRMLRPHHELTYGAFVAMGFDPDASLQLGLDVANCGSGN